MVGTVLASILVLGSLLTVLPADSGACPCGRRAAAAVRDGAGSAFPGIADPPNVRLWHSEDLAPMAAAAVHGLERSRV